MNGSAVNGWTHQMPTLLFANSTICSSPARTDDAPCHQGTLSEPPCAASGTLVNTIDGDGAGGLGRQPATRTHVAIDSACRHLERVGKA